MSQIRTANTPRLPPTAVASNTAGVAKQYAAFQDAAKALRSRAFSYPLDNSMKRIEREVDKLLAPRWEQGPLGNWFMVGPDVEQAKALMTQAIADWGRVAPLAVSTLDQMAQSRTPVVKTQRVGVQGLLGRLAHRGVSLSVDEFGNLMATPKGQLNSVDLDQIHQCRKELVQALQSSELVE